MGALDKVVAAAREHAALSRMSPEEVALAYVRVPDYNRSSPRGAFQHVHGYTRMGRDAQQAHLVSAHGMHPSDFGGDFAHPESLAAWHGQDHLARGSAIGHSHAVARDVRDAGEAAGHGEAEHAAGGAAGHGGGRHALEGMLVHHAAWEGPVIVHREVRRTADRQVRRRAYRLFRHRRGGARGAPGAQGAGSQGSGSSSSSSSSGGSSGSSGSNSSG